MCNKCGKTRHQIWHQREPTRTFVRFTVQGLAEHGIHQKSDWHRRQLLGASTSKSKTFEELRANYDREQEFDCLDCESREAACWLKWIHRSLTGAKELCCALTYDEAYRKAFGYDWWKFRGRIAPRYRCGTCSDELFCSWVCAMERALSDLGRPDGDMWTSMSKKYAAGMHTKDIDEDSETEELPDEMWAAIFDQIQSAPKHKCPLSFITWCDDCELMTVLKENRSASQSLECGCIPGKLCRGGVRSNEKQPSGQAVKQHLKDKATSCRYHRALLALGNEKRLMDRRREEKS